MHEAIARAICWPICQNICKYTYHILIAFRFRIRNKQIAFWQISFSNFLLSTYIWEHIFLVCIIFMITLRICIQRHCVGNCGPIKTHVFVCRLQQTKNACASESNVLVFLNWDMSCALHKSKNSKYEQEYVQFDLRFRKEMVEKISALQFTQRIGCNYSYFQYCGLWKLGNKNMALYQRQATLTRHDLAKLLFLAKYIFMFLNFQRKIWHVLSWEILKQ